MSKWIDDVVAKQTPDERANNLRRTTDASDAAVLQSGAGTYLENVTREVEILARELDEKLGATLGGVTFQAGSDRGFKASSGGFIAATVRGLLNLKERRIEVSVTKKGPDVVQGVSDTELHTFPLVVAAPGLFASTTDGTLLDEPALAAQILEDHFLTNLLVRMNSHRASR